jgi:hypothetical protein
LLDHLRKLTYRALTPPLSQWERELARLDSDVTGNVETNRLRAVYNVSVSRPVPCKNEPD